MRSRSSPGHCSPWRPTASSAPTGFDTSHGGAILWQHLFWFFGHPEVYIIALPVFGIVTEIFPVFSRKPLFGYVGLVGAMLGIAVLRGGVGHHMFVTGAVQLVFFLSGMSFLIAVPTVVKFFNWIGSMWGGSLTFKTPMLWSLGSLTTFPLRRSNRHHSGLATAGLPRHRPLLPGRPLPLRGLRHGGVRDVSGFYIWWPKITGKILDERLGKIHFSLLLIGFHTTFLVHHWLVSRRIPRRYSDYSASNGFTRRRGTLRLPARIHSESPAFDLHHPEIENALKGETRSNPPRPRPAWS